MIFKFPIPSTQKISHKISEPINDISKSEEPPEQLYNVLHTLV